MATDTDTQEARPEEWTAGALAEFCDLLAEKNYFAKETASSYKTAVTRVMEKAEGEGWESVGLKDVDLDLLFTRFMNAARNDFSASTLRAYRNRFQKALDEYDSWIDAPDSYSPSIQRRSPSSSSNGSKAAKNEQEKEEHFEPRANGSGATAPDAELIEYPFPLRPGVLAHLRLPADLRPKEAERIARHVESLAIPETPALNPGSRELESGTE